MQQASSLLGGLTAAAFLKRHWQKHPLLIRAAIPGFKSGISAEELAGLACEKGVEARLVIQTGRQPYWHLRHGPFAHRDFTRLPRSRWTLLVQDVDKHVPRLASLLDAFCFIPNWRIDDLMVSYAADGGSVGPHVDAYDVFLLQAQGLRRWDISKRPHRSADTPGLELRHVRDFTPEESWLLRPGDMLYLPPGVAHQGVAVGDCMTYSIGFRAPSAAELLTDFAGLLMEGARRDVHYSDPDLTATDHPGEIGAKARARVRTLLRSQFTVNDAAIDIWFGRFITEPKPWLKPAPRTRRISLTQFKNRLRLAKSLVWHPAVHAAWFDTRGACHLFVDGAHHPLPAGLRRFTRTVGDRRAFETDFLLRYANHKAAGPLLLQFLNAGQLMWR